VTGYSTPVHIVAPYVSRHTIQIIGKDANSELLEWLSRRFPYRHCDIWKQRIADRLIKVNGAIADTDYVLRLDDQVTIVNPRVVEPAVPDAIRIVDDKPDYLVVDKPAPMPIHPGGRYNKNSLIRLLEERGYNSLKIIHRLDAVTSGLVLLAKTTDFAKSATRCFSNGEVNKNYIAVVKGDPSEDQIEINKPIRRKSGHVFEWHDNQQEGKQAISRFKVLERLDNRSIVSCIPVTGRTHQLRLHLQYWGHPIIDDPLYAHEFEKPHHAPQRRAISLRHVQLSIPQLGIDYLVNPYFTIDSGLTETARVLT